MGGLSPLHDASRERIPPPQSPWTGVDAVLEPWALGPTPKGLLVVGGITHLVMSFGGWPKAQG